MTMDVVLMPEAVARRCSIKWVFLTISQDSEFFRVFFFFCRPQPVTLLKKTLAQVLFCEFYEIFKSTFFTEHLRVTASVKTLLMIFNRYFST